MKSFGVFFCSLDLSAASQIQRYQITYLPAAGHGFVKDDFRWVNESRVRSLQDLVQLVMVDGRLQRQDHRPEP